jgi:hypothetical protein
VSGFAAFHLLFRLSCDFLSGRAHESDAAPTHVISVRRALLGARGQGGGEGSAEMVCDQCSGGVCYKVDGCFLFSAHPLFFSVGSVALGRVKVTPTDAP